MTRSSGILLHPTSLPGDHGIGTLGPHARRFVAALATMKQSWWQVLPLGPTGYGDSPYQSPSTFAGNPSLISFDDLVEASLLDATRLEDRPRFPSRRVDFPGVLGWRNGVLATVAADFDDRARSETREAFEAFRADHGTTWLEDFAVFTAIKRSLGHRPWWEWPADLRRRDAGVLAEARSSLAESVDAVMVEQFVFDLQFQRLRARCAEVGVGLVGDVPIFVAHDSADVWAAQHLFHLDEAGMPTVVAGVPPDYFSETGQRWGNPLYRWDVHELDGFSWWTARMKRSFEMYDLVRVDHFRGFEASWHIPAAKETAVEGEWVPAPGSELFDHIGQVFDRLPLIAEDLGVITPEVEALRDRYGFPGMKVLQFGFGTESAHAPDQITERVVAYTGTHDNETVMGWFDSPRPDRTEERETALEVLETDGTEFNWDMISAVFESPARIAIVPLQDVLGLGNEARMNTPGTSEGNWQWRFEWNQLGEDDLARLGRLTETTRRSRSSVSMTRTTREARR